MARTKTQEVCGGAGRYLLAILVLGCAPGCLSQQLGATAKRTVNTWFDLHYQQVIDNLAKIASNPGFLPHLAVAGHGSVQVTDSGSSLLAVNVPPRVIPVPGSLNLGSSRNVTGTWSLGTITSPEKIRSMQSLYLRAIAGRAAGDPAFDWLKMGARGDVPRDASYVGHHGDLYVWVMPAGIEGLSDLTLAIMDVATSDDAVTTAVVDSGSLPGTAGPAGVPRRNFQVPPMGPVFTPGAR